MKNIIKKILYSIFNFFGVFMPKNRVSILLYHDVGESDLYLTVSEEKFKKQMRYLYKNGYNIVPLINITRHIRENKRLPEKTVILTFDDGYRSHLYTVLPVLKKHGFYGTFFVSTGAIGEQINNSEDKPQPVLSVDEIKELEQSKIADVQPHSVSHRELTSISTQEVRREVIESKKTLENMLAKVCNLFAYPRGKYSQEIVDITKEAGIEGAVTVEGRSVHKSDNSLALPRYTINSATSMAEFKAKLSR